jgi:hypothetical protein
MYMPHTTESMKKLLYPQIHYLTITGTKLDTFVKTTDIVPVDSFNNKLYFHIHKQIMKKLL